ncbi:MAG: dTDP-4-dehydrorhamnose 3,5-epimerase [Flavobacteriales bacterium]|nr:dTDP-4-dehydrorhamnose 3,5-epimerase [Flavobacteriales bacterium]
MQIEKTGFENLLILHPAVHTDNRGSFLESFNEARFRIETGMNITFVQDNESISKKDVLRGLHFQIPPASQAKLVRVAKGKVLDVVVDMRQSQRTFGKQFSVELSSENKIQLFIPEGFAHGFLVLEDDTIFSYKCSNYYDRECDRSLLWNDPDLKINWGNKTPILSDKDNNAPTLKSLDGFFF